ncbi:MAG: VTT domain-containing protein [Armatimonadetes bacterium]|nr:VTT domain-containing protein [Armatimonadota bacterium]
MELLADFFHRLHNLEELIRWGGYTVLVAIVFAETGLFVGFFLPGDSLLVTAGVFAAQGYLDIGLLILLLCIAATTGQATGYWWGARFGSLLYSRPDSRFFKRKYVLKAREFYEHHGGKAIVIARFVPILRTFVPIVAGIAGMNYRRFTIYNLWGGIGWVVGMCLIGYFVGRLMPGIVRRIDLLIAVVVILSFMPAAYHIWKERRAARAVPEAETETAPR